LTNFLRLTLKWLKEFFMQIFCTLFYLFFFFWCQGISSQWESIDREFLKQNNVSVKLYLSYEIISPTYLFRKNQKYRFEFAEGIAFPYETVGNLANNPQLYLECKINDFNINWLEYTYCNITTFKVWILFSV
jgi:hypothetical protein